MNEMTEIADKTEQNMTIVAVCAIGIILGMFITMLTLKCFNKDMEWKSATIGATIGCIITNAIFFSYLHFA
ncbi:MAG: hypothetical protein ACRC77_12920 [Bacteroidales bacterium]